MLHFQAACYMVGTKYYFVTIKKNVLSQSMQFFIVFYLKYLFNIISMEINHNICLFITKFVPLSQWLSMEQFNKKVFQLPHMESMS